jgi:Peptidase inhibitor family I36
MTIKQRVLVLVLATVAGLVAAMAPGTAMAAPASPAQAPGTCPADSLCLYEGGNYGGRVHVVPGSARNAAIPGFEDRASSWFNGTARPVCIMDNSDPHISTILARVLPNTGGNATSGWFGTNDKADFVTTFCPILN